MKYSKSALRAQRLHEQRQQATRTQAERRQRRLERRKAQRAEQGAASVLAADTVDGAPDQWVTGTELRYTLADLEDKGVNMLKEAARELGLKGYSKMKRAELIEYIYQSEENLTVHYAVG